MQRCQTPHYSCFITTVSSLCAFLPVTKGIEQKKPIFLTTWEEMLVVREERQGDKITGAHLLLRPDQGFWPLNYSHCKVFEPQ